MRFCKADCSSFAAQIQPCRASKRNVKRGFFASYFAMVLVVFSECTKREFTKREKEKRALLREDVPGYWPPINNKSSGQEKRKENRNERIASVMRPSLVQLYFKEEKNNQNFWRGPVLMARMWRGELLSSTAAKKKSNVSKSRRRNARQSYCGASKIRRGPPEARGRPWQPRRRSLPCGTRQLWPSLAPVSPSGKASHRLEGCGGGISSVEETSAAYLLFVPTRVRAGGDVGLDLTHRKGD